ncbi:hypothetical protein DMP07_08200 [Slackia faecicanis]|uniref:Uncharacterized protein n=1 Tax=Slackia faecicanis TaxID=255723 RepID=A0A3N0ADJ8_9ACTN|nr:hypothetical protein DMP07_08200 [Slackia faecicanis]
MPGAFPPRCGRARRLRPRRPGARPPPARGARLRRPRRLHAARRPSRRRRQAFRSGRWSERCAFPCGRG